MQWVMCNIAIIPTQNCLHSFLTQVLLYTYPVPRSSNLPPVVRTLQLFPTALPLAAPQMDRRDRT